MQGGWTGLSVCHHVYLIALLVVLPMYVGPLLSLILKLLVLFSFDL